MKSYQGERSGKGLGHRVAYFVSPHGFGHAARAAAVMEAMGRLDHSLVFHVFTTVPPWFFEESLSVPFVYHSYLCDIGMVQKGPLESDVEETVKALKAFLPFQPSVVASLAQQLRHLGCPLVMCDISPLGIAAAQHARLPSVLIENFTWDWVYRGCDGLAGAVSEQIVCLEAVFAQVSYHIQTRPVCRSATADLVTGPVSRAVRVGAEATRKALHVPPNKRLLLITMGGIRDDFRFLEDLTGCRNCCFVVPGAAETARQVENVLLLPHHAPYYHPDLVHACDAVVGKLGYSTLAEAYDAGTPFGYVLRPGFPESAKLAAFVKQHMAGVAFDPISWRRGTWVRKIPELLSLEKKGPERRNGAHQIARFAVSLLKEGAA